MGFAARTTPHAAPFVVAATLLAALLSTPVAAQEFNPGCTLPFAAIAKKQDLDETCGAAGAATAGPHAAQNRAKNNFCATGAPVPVTHQSFIALQREVDKRDIPYGSSNRLPPDRDVLKNILKLPNGKRLGEGDVVQYVAFISHPRNSNVMKGESVNCKEKGAASNDIHFDLIRRPNEGEPACRSITAEITPHFRPTHWEVPKLRLLRTRPVRITGHLFFDGSHKPCTSDDDTVNPKRASVWEIHPVYGIDVCRHETLKACTVKGNHWLPLHQWLNKEQEEEEDE